MERGCLVKKTVATEPGNGSFGCKDAKASALPVVVGSVVAVVAVGPLSVVGA